MLYHWARLLVCAKNLGASLLRRRLRLRLSDRQTRNVTVEPRSLVIHARLGPAFLLSFYLLDQKQIWSSSSHDQYPASCCEQQ